MKKAQIITTAEIKGGTGKTTTAASIAQAAAIEGKKVLIIDLDAQANITSLFGASITAPGAFELLQEGAAALDVIQETEQGPDIIAGAPGLYYAELRKIETLANAIEPIITKYDLIIIDTPPALNALTFNAMQASTGLVISLVADIGSADGLLLTLDHARKVKESNPKLKILGAVVTQYDNRANINRRLRQLVEDAATAAKCPYLGEIRQGVSIKEAAAYCKNLFEYAPNSKPAADYMRVYKQIIK